MEVEKQNVKVLVVGDLCTISINLLPYLLSKDENNKIEFCLTDLSDTMILEKDLVITYDFVLFYVDMENEHSWHICNKLLSSLSTVFCIQYCCLLINKQTMSALHTFSSTEVENLVSLKKIPVLSFDSDNDEEAIESVQSVYHLLELALPSKLSSCPSTQLHSCVSSYLF